MTNVERAKVKNYLKYTPTSVVYQIALEQCFDIMCLDDNNPLKIALAELISKYKKQKP